MYNIANRNELVISRKLLNTIGINIAEEDIMNIANGDFRYSTYPYVRIVSYVQDMVNNIFSSSMEPVSITSSKLADVAYSLLRPSYFEEERAIKQACRWLIQGDINNTAYGLIVVMRALINLEPQKNSIGHYAQIKGALMLSFLGLCRKVHSLEIDEMVPIVDMLSNGSLNLEYEIFNTIKLSCIGVKNSE